MLTQFRRPNTRILFLMFGVSGGFYYSKIFGQTVKRIWWILNIISFLYGSIIAVPSYILTTTEIKSMYILYISAVSMCFTYGTIFIPSVTYYYRCEIMSVLKNLDDEFDCPEPKCPEIDTKRIKYDSICTLLKWTIVGFVALIPFLFSNVAYVMIICYQNCFDNQLIYVEATPFTKYIVSMDVYLIIISIQALHCIFCAIQGLCGIPLVVMLAYKFHDVCINLVMHIDHLVSDTVLKLKLIKTKLPKRRFTKVEKKLGSVESIVFLEFKANFAVLVECFQKLTRYTFP